MAWSKRLRRRRAGAPAAGELGPAADQRLTALVHGFVQGVGYRDFCSRTAYRLDPVRLSGVARNLPNGTTVEVVAEGPRPLLEALLDTLYEGPGMARVFDIEVTWGAATHEFDRFTTRY